MKKLCLPAFLFLLFILGQLFFSQNIIVAETSPGSPHEPATTTHVPEASPEGLHESTPAPHVPETFPGGPHTPTPTPPVPKASPAGGTDKSDTAQQAYKKPEISFGNPDFDFGKIFKGEKVEHIYTFENLGKGVLEISKVKTSCGCTAAVLSNKTVQPGEKGEIKATFNSSSYGGKIRKNLTVFSNDTNTPLFKLSLSGEIIEEVTLKPKNVNFGSIHVGKQITKTITVSSLTELDLKIEKISASKPFVKAVVKEKTEEGFLIQVSLKDHIKLGRFNGRIHVETNSKRQKKVTIPFFGEVVGDITTYPKKIYFGNITEGREVDQKLFVKINKENVKILEAKITPDFLSTKITEKYEQKNPHCLIEIKLHKNATIGKLDGMLELTTSSESQPLVQIPILGDIKES
ncbi:MAG: DUF1573 domain-containing protein [Planctomycetes bacterium]|nr:DUF1573 domain-containing protein [Planctomycetota bacterium]